MFFHLLKHIIIANYANIANTAGETFRIYNSYG